MSSPPAPAWRVLVLTSAGDKLPVRVPSGAAVADLRAAIEVRLSARTGGAVTVTGVSLLARSPLAPPGAPPDRFPLVDADVVGDVLKDDDYVHADVVTAGGGGRKRPAPADAAPAPVGAATPAAAPTKRPRPADDGPLSPAAAEEAGDRATVGDGRRPPVAPPPQPSTTAPLPYGLRPFTAYASVAERRDAVRDALRLAVAPRAKMVIYTQTPRPGWWPQGVPWAREWTKSSGRARSVYDALVAHGRENGAAGAAPPPPPPPPPKAPPPKAPPPKAPPLPDTQAATVGAAAVATQSRAGSAAPEGGAAAAAAPSTSPSAASRSAAPPAAAPSPSSPSTSASPSAASGSRATSSSSPSSSSSSGTTSSSSSDSATPSAAASPPPPPRPPRPPVETGPGVLHNLLVAATGVGEYLPTPAEQAAAAAAAAAAAGPGLPYNLHPLDDYASPRDARDALRDAATAAVNAERARAGAAPVSARSLFTKAAKPAWWPLDAWDRKKWADAPRGHLGAVFDALVRVGSEGGSAAGTGTVV